MKSTIALLALACATPAFAQNYTQYGTGSNPNSESVSGYTRSNGTYVQPYQRSAPDSTQYDNYSTRGNTNPYTGQTGTRSPRY